MNLESAPKKQNLEIVAINQEKLHEDAMRFGIEEGEQIQIISKLPEGPIVIQKNQQQIAIGRELAKAVEVKIKD
ncbi:MAG: ferrous iron transport protein A [Candidatus Melainabacteria bacterium]|nr:ferrous iron transport protein A [Candidatus Melainabacteria bacterium]